MHGGPGDLPAAMVDGERLEWADLLPGLVEAAGGAVLEEAVLGRLLEAECRRLGLVIDAAAVEAERDRLTRTLAGVTGLPGEDGEALLDRIRASRGLGATRFPALLRRNAMLRALVRAGHGDSGAVAVSDDDLRQAYALKYGPKVRIRIIVVRSEAEADAVVKRVRPDLGPPEAFGEVAAEVSQDPSATRGGLLDPFSLDDSHYPVALRRAISRLDPGETSDPVLVSAADQPGTDAASRQPRYAVARLEGVVPPPSDVPTPEEAASTLREEVRMVRERAAMDRLARRLVGAARLTIFDRGLDRSWKQQTGQP